MKKIKKTAFLTIIAIVIITIFGAVKWRSRGGVACSPILPVAQSASLINSLDQNAVHFASSSKDLMGQSTEGGVQIDYTDGGKRKIIEQRFYKETGHTYMRLYFDDSGDPFALVTLNENYAVPLSVDSNPAIVSGEERDYYLDTIGNVCSAYVNGMNISIDTNNQEMIQEYILGIIKN